MFRNKTSLRVTVPLLDHFNSSVDLGNSHHAVKVECNFYNSDGLYLIKNCEDGFFIFDTSHNEFVVVFENWVDTPERALSIINNLNFYYLRGKNKGVEESRSEMRKALGL